MLSDIERALSCLNDPSIHPLVLMIRDVVCYRWLSDCVLLGCDIASLGRSFPTFRKFKINDEFTVVKRKHLQDYRELVD